MEESVNDVTYFRNCVTIPAVIPICLPNRMISNFSKLSIPMKNFKKTSLLLVLFCSINNLQAQSLESYSAKVGDDYLYGYKDSLDAVIVQPQYKFAYDFTNGLGCVEVTDGKSGYINSLGKMVIPAVYVKARPFSEGLATVKDSAFTYIIDKTGKKKFPQKFSDAWSFTEGMLPVMNQESQWGYFDKTGVQVIPFQYQKARNFSDGIGFVQKGDSWIAINKTNQQLLDLKDYVHLQDFKNGYAAVCLKDDPKYDHDEEWTYIDKTGKIICDKRFTIAEQFENGVARVYEYNQSERESLAGAINSKGEIAIPLQYKALIRAGKCFKFSKSVGTMFPTYYGLINQNYEEVTEEKYKFGQSFGDTLFIVQQKEFPNGLNLINTKGKELIPLNYRSWTLYSNSKNSILMFYTDYSDVDGSLPGQLYNTRTGIISTEIYSPDMEYEIIAMHVFTPSLYNFHPAIIDLSGKVLVDKSYSCLYSSTASGNLGSEEDRYEKIVRHDTTWFFNKATKKMSRVKYFVLDDDDFSEGRLRVASSNTKTEYGSDDGKFGFVDSSLKMVIPFKYSSVDNFKNGRAKFGFVKPESYSSSYGFFDKAGVEVIKPIYSEATDFSNGYAFVQKGSDMPVLIIDKKGIVKATLSDKIEFYGNYEVEDNGVFLVRNSEKKWGLFNLAGKELIPMEYDPSEDVSMAYFTKNGEVVLYKDGKGYSFDKEGIARGY